MLKTGLYSLLILFCSLTGAVADETRQITFTVGCYDVGAAALENHPGVLKVDKGWQGFHEVNRVQYDPQQVDVEQLEKWLKQADTWRATLPEQSKE